MRSLYASIFALLLSAAPLASADCNNKDGKRCDYKDFGVCVAANNAACPTECVGNACFPSNDCMVANQQWCGFACCSFTDRSGCEKCADSAGMNAQICDSIDC